MSVLEYLLSVKHDIRADKAVARLLIFPLVWILCWIDGVQVSHSFVGRLDIA